MASRLPTRSSAVPPDDPGVREPAAGEKVPEKTNFRLF